MRGMLGFLMPADVSKSFMRPPGVVSCTANVPYECRSVRSRDAQSTENSSASVRSSLHFFRRHSEHWRTRLKDDQPAGY